MIKVGVFGHKGRMGATVCDAVRADPELELVACVDIEESPEEMVAGGAEVAVDFTAPNAVRDNIRFCLDNGIHAVVGTTGLTSADHAEIASWQSGSNANVFIAPNFAVGAVLMMQFARAAAPHFATAEIIERHHEGKLDAPSGTALRTAELMNEGRAQPWSVPHASKESLGGSRGGDVDGVRVHSLRMPGSVAHQEVILGAPGETLTIRHDSLDRASFMPGVLLAVKKVADRKGVTVGLENLLDL
jgi:4-hydroxy-tetrahydrodipicolinate reductase